MSEQTPEALAAIVLGMRDAADYFEGLARMVEQPELTDRRWTSAAVAGLVRAKCALLREDAGKMAAMLDAGHVPAKG